MEVFRACGVYFYVIMFLILDPLSFKPLADPGFDLRGGGGVYFVRGGG